MLPCITTAYILHTYYATGATRRNMQGNAICKDLFLCLEEVCVPFSIHPFYCAHVIDSLSDISEINLLL